MTIKGEIQSLSPSAVVELLVLDSTMLVGGEITRFHAGTNGLSQSVVWQGETYAQYPIETDGFDLTTQGTLPRPKIRMANVFGLMSSIAMEFDDLVGCKITRKRTLVKYLDAVNFPGGINPTADPSQKLPDETWYVERKVSESRALIEWELSSAFDLMGVMLPYRQVIQNSCCWKYKSAECGYGGTNYFDRNDTVTTVENDSCGKRLSSCKARFGSNAVLPYGGFPGAIRYG